MHQTEGTPQRLATFHPFAAGLPCSEGEEPPLPPVAEGMLPEGESDVLIHLNVLMDPLRTEEQVERLVQDGFLSEEIKEVESATIRMVTGQKGPVCIVSVGGKYGWNWDVVFLERGGRDWRRVGRIPLPQQKAYEPVLNYFHGQDASILSVERVSGYGTGLFRRDVTLYRVGAEGLVPVVTYPTSAYVVGWIPSFRRHIKAETTKRPSSLVHGSEMEVRFVVEYGPDPMWLARQGLGIDDDFPLFTHGAILALEWHEKLRTFIPAKCSSAQLDEVDGYFDDGIDQFVKRYVDKLAQLLVAGEPLQRCWVREILGTCSPSLERDHLLKVVSSCRERRHGR